MSSEKPEKIYCSLDIETSGFDPQKDEILEIGFVFFEADQETSPPPNLPPQGGGIRTGEEYSRVFKPKGEVSETILALTGIRKTELAEADSFAEHREEIQEQLKDACLVGHNIGFDIKFLQGLGLKFSGQTIDTLDLAQFILPTHPSYNLENLMNYFGVPHTEAHRALADAKATLLVLEGLLKAFSDFPQGLKSEITAIAKSGKFAWQELLTAEIKAQSVKPKKKQKKEFSENLGPIKLVANKFYNFSLGDDLPGRIISSLKEEKQSSLLVLPNFSQVTKFWKKGQIEPAFAASQTFDEKAFKALKSRPDLSKDELKFILKILVWQETNWQSENISDLNLSFFGGQFKQRIVGKMGKEKIRETVLACDLPAFFEFLEKGWYKSRKIVFIGLDDLEKALSENLGEKISWGRFNYLLKGIYNPESQFGDVTLSEEIEAGLVASDLFFGLTSALLQSNPPAFLQVKFEQGVLPEETMNKISSAAENFGQKLGKLNLKIKSEDIGKALVKLKGFFEISENRVKWLELGANFCAFHSSPVKINDLANKLLVFGKEATLCDCLPKERVWEYFQARLGAGNFQAETVPAVKINKAADLFSFTPLEPSAREEGWEKQDNLQVNGGLESSLVLTGFIKPGKLLVEAKSTDLKEAEILKLCSKSNLPAVVLLGNAAVVKDFYHKFHAELQLQAFVLAQLGSGSSRLLRNFAIHKETLLLATPRFILKSLFAQGAGASLGSLNVKTLVIGSLPFDQYKHPYLDAVSKQFKNPFEEFSLPKALLNLHRVIGFFFSGTLKKLLIADSKFCKPYGQVFLGYLESIVDR